MRPSRSFVATRFVAVIGLAVVGLTGCGKDFSRGRTTGESEPAPKTDARAVDKVAAARTNVSLGRAYLQQGQFRTALDHLEKALALDPKSTDGHTVIAILYEKIGQDDDAQTHYKRAVELAPKSGDTNNNYGAYLCRHQRYEEADDAFSKALADPFYTTPAIAWSNRGACAANWGRNDLAEESLRHALENDPTLTEPLLRLAGISSSKGYFMKARAFMQRYESAAKVTAGSLALGMKIEQSLGDARAESDYKKRLVAEFPDSPEAQQIREANDTP